MSRLLPEPLIDNGGMPLVLFPSETSDLTSFLGRHVDEVHSLLREYGALLFRDFEVCDPETFGKVVDAISSERCSYLYRSTPRTEIASGIYTATEYPPELEIPLHNENAYQRSWPMRLSFCCLTAAGEGGETPLADMRRVTNALDASLLERFRRQGVRYVRHYRPFADLPWQVVFQTNDAAEVGRFCESRDIDYEWLSDGTLRTSQTCQGTAVHPVTGAELFFNQAHLFHVSSLGAEMAQDLVDVFGYDKLPRNATFGDGVEFETAELESVREAFRRASVRFQWQRGDVLLLENMLVAHGRRPYVGPRKVLVSLFDSFSPNT